MTDTIVAGGGRKFPMVSIAILAKQKAKILPTYLRHIEELDYPKHRIRLIVRTNDSTDQTQEVLEEWVARSGIQYARVDYSAASVDPSVSEFDPHDWNTNRFRVLGKVRQESLDLAVQDGSGYYFVADVDNYLKPSVLRELVQLDLPIVAPLLAHTDPACSYSNFHFKTNEHGYRPHDRPIDEETWIRWLMIRGIIAVDCVHCTYLVRADVAPLLRYDDGSGRHEYAIFAESARRNGVQQYIDNREVYGCLDMEDSPEAAHRWFTMKGNIYG